MNLFEGIFASMDENERVQELETHFKTAKKLNKKKCLKCGYCCHKKTCIPTPNEVRKIAKFLKMDVKDMINNFFAIDRQNYGDSYYIKPVGENIKDLAGKFIPSNRTFNEGKCIFLNKNNLCKIHKVKPKSAKVTGCWKEITYNSKKLFNTWEKNALKKLGFDGKKLEDDEDEL